jgi:hypothetical protein
MVTLDVILHLFDDRGQGLLHGLVSVKIYYTLEVGSLLFRVKLLAS